MKKIRLLRDHTAAGVTYPAGETIEVTDEQYEWLKAYYLSLRKQQVEKESAAESLLKKAGVLNDATSD